ncbi:type II toxin-antitoxin system HicB family antitoxin [Candidatus Electrothrix sp.]|uniref:type II toxin-antitoxin system HicB family antitoxin n=1 Tax=Candidatus Electrothrix sp. TaxID=2170559 RepID=UPI004055A531
MNYPVAIHKDEDSGYGVTFPDIPGCFSAGDSIEEALAMAREAAECHIEGLLLDAEPIPVARPVEDHRNNKEYQDALWALIDIDLSKLSLKSKRINISIPERLLNVVDHFAGKHGETRSGLLAQAVTEYMAARQ